MSVRDSFPADKTFPTEAPMTDKPSGSAPAPRNGLGMGMTIGIDWPAASESPTQQPPEIILSEDDPPIHVLKTWPEFFAAVLDGSKTFEVRLDDRCFEVGDSLLLKEYDPTTREYTGREITKRISYLMEGGQFGLAPGFNVLALAPAASPSSRPEIEKMLEALVEVAWTEGRSGTDWSCNARIAPKAAAILDYVRRIEKERDAWVEAEAAICPEDVGFPEFIRSLQAELASLRADAKRLDWLQRERPTITSAWDEKTKNFGMLVGSAFATTLRSAIDAAMGDVTNG